MIVASLRGKLRKESLANCSLVCNSWIPVSSKYLFEEFSWPCDIGDKPCCEEGGGIKCFVRLRELLSSCHRVSNTIRTLRLKHHARRNAERSSVPISLLLQIFDTLPQLHTAKLPFAFSRMLSPVSDVELWPMIPRTRRLEELQIGVRDSASTDAAFDLLSAFAQITKLKLRHLSMVDAGRPRTYPPSPTLQVQSLAISGAGRTPVLELRGLIDFNAIRSLSLISFPPDTRPSLAPLIQSMASLTSLEYLVSESVAPNWPPADSHLHSPSLVVVVLIRCSCSDSDIGLGEEELPGIGQWGSAMRDLELMVTADTRNVGITLIVLTRSATHVNSECGYKHGDPEGIAMVQEETFSRFDWKRLESIA